MLQSRTLRETTTCQMGRSISMVLLLTALLAIELPTRVNAQNAPSNEAGLAPTPPMGWGSWNPFFCEYNEQTIRSQADALISTGMRDAGYNYVLIQECIARERDSEGNLIADSARFPSGMPALTTYIHKLGLKAGIYTDIGPYTCSHYLGSYGHELQDAKTFANWGMDHIFVDYCNKDPDHTGREIYERMAEGIRKTGRPMLLYICSWGNESPWLWAQGKAQVWRTDSDLSAEPNRGRWERVVRNFKSNSLHAAFSAPDSWNDPDMLEVGNPGLNETETRTHFAMWAISAAPLWAGTDLTKMSKTTLEIYANSEVIAVDQDPLGAQATRVREDGMGREVWSKPLGSKTSGKDAILLLNLTDTPAKLAVGWNDLGLIGPATVRDLWARKDIGTFRDGYDAELPPHGSLLLKISGNFSWAKGATYDAEWPGNIREGDTSLYVCPTCNSGYAVALAGTTAASLRFTHLNATRSGKYSVTLSYVNTEQHEFKEEVEMQVNELPAVAVELNHYMNASVTIPIELRQGDNSLIIRYKGRGSAYIDSIRLTQ